MVFVWFCLVLFCFGCNFVFICCFAVNYSFCRFEKRQITHTQLVWFRVFFFLHRDEADEPIDPLKKEVSLVSFCDVFLGYNALRVAHSYVLGAMATAFLAQMRDLQATCSCARFSLRWVSKSIYASFICVCLNLKYILTLYLFLCRSFTIGLLSFPMCVVVENSSVVYFCKPHAEERGARRQSALKAERKAAKKAARALQRAKANAANPEEDNDDDDDDLEGQIDLSKFCVCLFD